MKIHCRATVFLALGSAAAASFEVRTDLTNAPDGGEYAQRAKAICVEWYPRINEILYGPGAPSCRIARWSSPSGGRTA